MAVASGLSDSFPCLQAIANSVSLKPEFYYLLWW